MKKIAILSVLVALAGCNSSTPIAPLPAAPATSTTAQQQKLKLTGSSTLAPLAKEFAKRFEAAHNGVSIDIQMGGSTRGANDAIWGLADIGDISRELTPQEKAQGLVVHTIAKDGIAILVHKDNPVKELTKDQIVGIYTGKITDWKQVGGNPGKIMTVSRQQGHSTLELFLEYFKIKDDQLKAAVIMGDNEEGIHIVATNVNAINYMSIGAVEADIQKGRPLKLLPLNGVAASVDNVRNGTFPLQRPLAMVTHGEAKGLAKDFIDYSMSRDVQDAVTGQFFVSVNGN